MDTQHTSKPTALIWVESLRGSGHMRVASTIQRALQKQGYEVHIATSSRHFAENFDFEGVHWHSLPGMQMDSQGFQRMTPNGLTIGEDAEYGARRAEALKHIVDQVKPSAIITENWPLGRADFDQELEDTLRHVQATHPKTQCFSLSREILFGGVARQPKEGIASAEALLRRYFNGGVIVLGSRDAPGLPISMPEAKKFEDKLFYAGYMASDIPPRNPHIPDAQREVLVSVGGGATTHGFMLAEMAIRAHGKTKNSQRAMQVFVPTSYQQQHLADGTSWKEHLLRAAEEENKKMGRAVICVRDNSPDFLHYLADASMSISQGGSNTTFEVASAEGVDALIAPFKQGYQDIGQEVRGQIFRDLGLVHIAELQVVDPSNPEKIHAFAQKIDAAIGSKKQAEQTLQAHVGQSNFTLFGAEHAAAYIDSVVRGHALDPRHNHANQQSPWEYNIRFGKETVPGGNPQHQVLSATVERKPRLTESALEL